MRNAVWDDERPGTVGPELDDGGHPFRRGPAAQVPQPNSGPADRNREVVVMPQMDVDTAEHARL